MASAPYRFLAFIFCVLMKSVHVAESQACRYDKAYLERAEIIPDVIDSAPEKAIKVVYSNNIVVNFGTNLTQSDISVAPTIVEWPADRTFLYTLIMTDPDVPCRKYPTQREWVHWMISNIPGNEWRKGNTVCRYINPQRAVDGTRYVFLVYKQPDNKPIHYKDMEQEGSLHRVNFSVRVFAKNYSLGEPTAVNFFEIPFDIKEKEEERQRNEQIRYNMRNPPTRTRPPTTKSYRDLSNPHVMW